jgi:hypothetical protein
MPVLDATALESDPDGMAFLRAVIRPTLERGATASRRPSGRKPKRSHPASQTQGEVPLVPVASKVDAILPAAQA